MKISTTSFYNSLDIRYNSDTGRSNNYILLHLYKRLFHKNMNKYIRQPKTCKLKLRHNDKEKICKFFVVHHGSLTVLGIQDIDRLGMLSINRNSKNRQVAEESNEDKGKSTRQTKGNRCEQLKGGEEETETHTQDAKYNPMVMGYNNNELIASLSEGLINQNSIAGAETKDDATTMDMQINCDSIDVLMESVTHNGSFITDKGENDKAIIGLQVNYDIVDPLAELLTNHNSFIIEAEAKDTTTQNNTIISNTNESLFVGMSTGGDKQAQTTHNKKRKCNKNKKYKGNW